MSRFPSRSALALIALLAGPAAAAPADDRLHRQIDETAWNLQHSSVSTRIDAGQKQRALRLLEQARQELAAGHRKTAQGLIRQAASPLVAMSPASQSASHPDRLRQLSELRETVRSIADGAVEVAREKGVSTPIALETRKVLRRSDALQRQGRTTQAIELLQKHYAQVQVQVAAWRDGDRFVIRAPDGQDAAQWDDGRRRIEDRRALTEYLIVEARAEGIDPSPLYEAIRIADTSLEKASSYASSQRWDQAYRTLDLAYAEIEGSWKKVGVEW